MLNPQLMHQGCCTWMQKVPLSSVFWAPARPSGSTGWARSLRSVNSHWSKVCNSDHQIIIIFLLTDFWQDGFMLHIYVAIQGRKNLSPTCWFTCCCKSRPGPPASSCCHSTQASSQAEGTWMFHEVWSQIWVARATAWISGAILLLLSRLICAPLLYFHHLTCVLKQDKQNLFYELTDMAVLNRYIKWQVYQINWSKYILM